MIFSTPYERFFLFTSPQDLFPLFQIPYYVFHLLKTIHKNVSLQPWYTIASFINTQHNPTLKTNQPDVLCFPKSSSFPF